MFLVNWCIFIVSSVTRFKEIATLWLFLKIFDNFLAIYCSIGQVFEFFKAFREIFIAVNWAKYWTQIIYASGHTDRLQSFIF